MAEYPPLSFADISAFSGRALSDYDPVYSTTAIAQATLLFKIATCLTQLPDDETAQALAKAAILDMAEKFILVQPYAATMASPFTSESIGSYSYSKMAQQIISKERTGVMWFDLAVSELSVCDEMDQAFFYGGIEVMEHDNRYVRGDGGGGNLRVLDNEELHAFNLWLAEPYSRGPYGVY